MASNNEKNGQDDGYCEPQQKYLSAEKFVDELLTIGNKVSCDETSDAFRDNFSLPPFYDESLYKRGQTFYYKHIFAIFLSKLFGLIIILAVPSINAILRFTKMSCSDLKSYRRYMATIFHMCIWYDQDFKPGSRIWKSILEVRRKHNSASNRSCVAGLDRITQCDMALTQFGFMGIAVTKKEKVGIFHTNQEEWKSFIHIWRVVGYLMGIEDRFNICRESVEETEEICRLLIERVFLPKIVEREENFLEMSKYLLNGMWCFCPVIEQTSILNHLFLILQDRNTNNNNIRAVERNEYIKLSEAQKRKLNFNIFVINNLKYSICRLYHNSVHRLSIWIMKIFPFLAYYKFGKMNAHVNILEH